MPSRRRTSQKSKICPRLPLVIPSVFVVSPPEPPEPPPIPGTVEASDLASTDSDEEWDMAVWQPLELTMWDKGSFEDPNASRKTTVSMLCEPNPIQINDEARYIDVVSAVFNDAEDDVDAILASLRDPLMGHSDIHWTVVRGVRPPPRSRGGKASQCRHKFTHGLPWSVCTVAEGGLVRKNYIYDGDGRARAEVDFGCGLNPHLHLHPLIPGSLDHPPTASDHHCFSWSECPWLWLAFPDVRYDGDDDEDAGGLWGVPTWIADVKNGSMQWCAVSVPYVDAYDDADAAALL